MTPDRSRGQGKRYSIMVMQYGSKTEVELCQVDCDPHAIAKAAAEKTLRIVGSMGRVAHVRKYDSVRVVDHEPPAEG